MTLCGCKHLVANKALRGDPTRTQTLRERFARDIAGRYDLLAAKITDAIVTQDVFGLAKSSNVFAANANSGLAPGAFAFSTNPEKVGGFMNWVSEEVDKGVLELAPGAARTVTGNPAWTDMYITSGYKRGMMRADSELRKAGLSELDGPLDVDAAFNTPFHADRVGMLYTRTFEELKGAAGRLEQKMQRVLSEELALGMAEGRSPTSIAKALRDVVGLERSYAKTLARTEIIRAHHVGNINTYRQAGVEGVTVQAEWSTSGFNVCPDCADLQGRVFSLAEIEGLIPLHPNCRCVALPFQKGDVSAEYREDIVGEQYRRKDGSFKKRGLLKKKTGSVKRPGRVGKVSAPLRPAQPKPDAALMQRIDDAAKKETSGIFMDTTSHFEELDRGPDFDNALMDYVGAGADLNAELRSGQWSPWAKELVPTLDDAFTAAKPVVDDVVVYRAATDEFLKKVSVGGSFIDDGFVSTSMTQEATLELFEQLKEMNLKPARFRILIPKGHPGMDISAHSPFVDQAEFLLPRGTEFTVVRKVEENGVAVWDLIAGSIK